MEYGGLMAAVDDLYVHPAYRDRGLAPRGMADARDACARRSIRAMTVGLAGDNGAALSAYTHASFEMTDRRLMTLPLATPTHERGGPS